MDFLRIKNVRSIEDSGTVEVKPITVIAGRNSCGKSSFLRMFPLLKQTIEKRVSEPILWYGDYVDFGEYYEVINKKHKGECIQLEFGLTNNSEHIRWRYYESIEDVRIKLFVTEKLIERVEIRFKDQKMRMDLGGKNGKIQRLLIDDMENIIDSAGLVARRNYGEIIPRILREREGDFYARYYSSHLRGIDEESKIIDILKGMAGPNTRRVNIMRDIRQRMRLGSKREVLANLQSINFSSRILKKRLSTLQLEDEEFVNINAHFIGEMFSEVIDIANIMLREEINNISYIKPIRAMVNRYYRVQGVSVNELDSDGSNLPMILHNMSQKMLKDFEKWTLDTFGVVFSVKSVAGHVSLIIKETVDSKESINMADTGYGYSQILPIIVLLWNIKQKKNEGDLPLKTIVIEQPELHLHPALQGKLIDVLVYVVEEARKNNVLIKIIFETHSETMINRLGYLVAKNYVSKEKINILIFDKINGTAKIRTAKFKENGALEDWPLGFFLPEPKEKIIRLEEEK